MKKGTFIVIDGTDGSGKATQTALLVERLQSEGKKVNKIDFPQYKDNHFGKLLRQCLDGKLGDFVGLDPHIASTIYAADRFESSGKIREWLSKGEIVISDRYVSANQIHQGGKIRDEKKREEFLLWLEQMEYGVFKIPKPDVIVYLHVPLEVSLALIKARAKETGVKSDQAEEDPKHLLESQESALSIVKSRNNWIMVDCAQKGAMRAREDIHEVVFKKIKKYL